MQIAKEQTWTASKARNSGDPHQVSQMTEAWDVPRQNKFAGTFDEALSRVEAHGTSRSAEVVASSTRAKTAQPDADQDRTTSSRSGEEADFCHYQLLSGVGATALQADPLGRNDESYVAEPDESFAGARRSEELKQHSNVMSPDDANGEGLREGFPSSESLTEDHHSLDLIEKAEGARTPKDNQAGLLTDTDRVSVSKTFPQTPSLEAPADQSDTRTKPQIVIEEGGPDASIPPKEIKPVNTQVNVQPHFQVAETSALESPPDVPFIQNPSVMTGKAADGDLFPNAGLNSYLMANSSSDSESARPVLTTEAKIRWPTLDTTDEGIWRPLHEIELTDSAKDDMSHFSSQQVDPSVSGSGDNAKRFIESAANESAKSILEALINDQLSEMPDLGNANLSSAGYLNGHLSVAGDPFIVGPGKPLTSLASYQKVVFSQVTEAISRGVSTDQARTTELTLTPEEMGKLRFEITTRDDQTTIRVFAERGETLDLLRRNADSLVNELRQMGLSHGSLSFGSWSQRSKSESQTTDAKTMLEQTEAQPDSVHFLSSNPLQQGRLHIRL